MSGLHIWILAVFLPVTSALDIVTYTMLEERPRGYPIGNIKQDANLAQDYSADVYSRLTFSILTPVDGEVMSGDYFSVGETSGDLMVLSPLDRDREDICAFLRQCVMTFDVAVGPAEIFRFITVRVEIEDVNDNAPLFSLNELRLNISELASPGSTDFELPVVADRDGDDYGVEKMTMSPVMEQFAVRWSRIASGRVQPRLQLLSSVDREEVGTFDLTITAHDGGSPARTAILLVHVDIVDANDNSPRFDQPSYDARVSEDFRSGLSLLSVHASDTDSGAFGRIRYSLVTPGHAAGLFTIDDVTGEISLAPGQTLDRETEDTFLLSVIATDGARHPRDASATVTIYVDDVNDNPPVIRVTVLTDSGLAEVSESAGVGTFVALLSVTDQDWGRNSEVTCSLDNPAFRLVTVQTKKYKVVTSIMLDRETRDFYSLEVTCRDQGVPVRSSSDFISVHVIDFNDHDPIFQHGDVTVHVYENELPGTVVGQVAAEDLDLGDNAKLSYSIRDSTNIDVSIDENTGEITTTSRLDREESSEISFVVVASDDGDPPRSATCAFSIVVEDVNDMAPTFEQSAFTFLVTENEENRRELARLTATDLDGDPYNQFEYSLSGDHSDYFELDSTDGTLYAVRPIDREVTALLQLVAIATDINDATLSGTADVTIYISDVNDNAPRIDFPNLENNTVMVSSSAHVGDVVAMVNAVDDDEGQNAVLEHFMEFQHQRHSGLFRADVISGVVTVQNDLSEIRQEVVQCQVLVRDAGIPSLRSKANLTIIINESYPAFGHVSNNDDDVTKDKDDGNMKIVIIVVATTLVLVAILVGAIVFVLRKLRRKKRRNGATSGGSAEKRDQYHVTCERIDLEKQDLADCECGHHVMKPVIKIYDPRCLKVDTDSGSLGSGEGSTTDSGRGASEEGEHERGSNGHHNTSREMKPSPSVYSGSDELAVSGHSDFNTSFNMDVSHMQRPNSKNGKNVTFEDDVMVAEISDHELNHYDDESYDPVYHSGGYMEQWRSPEVETDTSLPTVLYNCPKRTVRNVKAKDKFKKSAAGGGRPEYDVTSQELDPAHLGNPYTFADSNSLLRYKMDVGDGGSGNASEVTDATSTTSGSYVIQEDDLQ